MGVLCGVHPVGCTQVSGCPCRSLGLLAPHANGATSVQYAQHFSVHLQSSPSVVCTVSFLEE